MTLLASLRGNIAGLTRFRGRQSPAQFWPYAGTVVVLLISGMMAAMVPFMFATMTRMQRFAAAHPDQATITSGPGSYSISISGNHPELFPDMRGMMIVVSVVFVIAVLLLAAATTRRLHDSNRSGLWGLMPLPFIAFSNVEMPRMFAGAGPDMSIFFYVFFSNLLYLVTLAVLVVMLVRSGTVGANRFGRRDGEGG